MGCSFGEPVTPGSRVTSVMAFQMSSSVLETLAVTVLVEFVFRLVVDDRLVHLYRCRVEGRVYTAPFSYY